MDAAELKELAEGLYLEDYIGAEQKELESKVQNEALLLAYKSLLKSPDGKRVMWDLLSFCGVFRNAMTGNSRTYYNLGQQSVGQYIMVMLNIGNKFEDVLDFQKLRPDDGEP